MKLSELTSLIEQYVEEHGDHEVWYQEHEGEAIPYRAEWFTFEPYGVGDSPKNVYVV